MEWRGIGIDMLGEYRGSDDSLDRLTSTTPCKRPYDYDPRGDRFLAVMRNESPRSLVLVLNPKAGWQGATGRFFALSECFCYPERYPAESRAAVS